MAAVTLQLLHHLGDELALQWSRGSLAAVTQLHTWEETPLLVLQWSRGSLAAVTRHRDPSRKCGRRASMEPRLIGRGNAIAPLVSQLHTWASMEPRLIGRGNVLGPIAGGARRRASMEPRLIGRGNLRLAGPGQTEEQSFNGAAAHWPR